MKPLHVLLCMGATSAAAQDVSIQFQDGAPSDSITISNAGCPIIDTTFVLNLVTSAGQLIFDTTGQGAGVSVFQPVETQSDNVSMSPVNDGDQVVDITVGYLPTNGSIQITADIDDTMPGGRQTVVDGSEMAGATLSARALGSTTTSVLGSDGAATLTLPDDAAPCVTG